MRVTIIGSGTLLPDPHHSSASHWVEFSDVRILLDCGSGALHGMARERLSWRGLSHLVMTHFHTDHIADLSPILFALRHGIRPPRTEEPLTLLGPRGLDAHVDALARAHGSYVRDPGFPVEVVELTGGEQWADPAGRFTLHAHSTPHTDVSIGVRLETPNGSLGYTGDTGPSPALGDFFAGVGALIAECSLADPSEAVNHLSPSSLAALARTADAQLLLVTHLFPPLRPHRVPGLAGYAGPLVVAKDGTTFEIEGGRTRLTDR